MDKKYTLLHNRSGAKPLLCFSCELSMEIPVYILYICPHLVPNLSPKQTKTGKNREIYMQLNPLYIAI